MHVQLFSTGLRSALFLLVLILMCLLNPTTAWSAEVSKVKGSQVLIVDFDGSVGAEYYAVDGNGKKKAIITVNKAKGGKAIGEITKGKAAVGYTLIERSKGSSAGPRRSSKSGGRRSAINIGVLGGFSMDSMEVPTTAGTQSMTGSGFSVKGAADYAFTPSLGIRLMGGYESFSVKNSTFETKINYVTIDALARYIFMPDFMFAPWFGAGIGFAIPFSKTTNILQEDSIATSTLLYVAGGFDFRLGGNWYIPFQVDYSMFLPASDVKTSIIGIRTGLMFGF